MTSDDVTQFFASPSGERPHEVGPGAPLEEAKTPCVGVGFVGNTLFGDGTALPLSGEILKGGSPHLDGRGKEAPQDSGPAPFRDALQCDVPELALREDRPALPSVGVLRMLKGAHLGGWDPVLAIRSASPKVAGLVGAILGISLAFGIAASPQAPDRTSSEVVPVAPSAPSASETGSSPGATLVPVRESGLARTVGAKSEKDIGAEPAHGNHRASTGAKPRVTPLAPVARSKSDSVTPSDLESTKDSEVNDASEKERTLHVLKEALALVQGGRCALAAAKYRTLGRRNSAETGLEKDQWWIDLDFEAFARNALAHCSGSPSQEIP